LGSKLDQNLFFKRLLCLTKIYFLTILSKVNLMEQRKYKVAIIGSGPAGIFAAIELGKKGIKDIVVIEKGNDIDSRDKRETMCGFGGGGTFSDGKLHFDLCLSQEKLLDFISENEAQELVNRVEKDFLDFGVDAPITPKGIEEAEVFIEKCQRHNISLYPRKIRHVGSDVLPIVIRRMRQKLTELGVEIITNCEITEIKQQNGVFELHSSEKIFTSSILLIAPGRIGTKWLQRVSEKIGLKYEYQKIEIGVRVEFPASITRKQTEVMYEAIYALHTPTFDDLMRTLCPCPNGYVAVENYDDYVCVNGHSNSQNESPNSNFALLQEVVLTDPVENTTDYAIAVARLTTTLGGGKPLVQRLADLRKGRRSTESRIAKSLVIPTLKDCAPGDIAMALPYRTVKNILEALDLLNNVLPGINSGSNLLYAPEIKLRGSRIKTNKNLETNIPGLFVAGDGAGVSGNIVGAAATGILAANGIIKKSCF